MRRVTGIGGIFFKARDPKALTEWYRVHLGMQPEDWADVKASLTPGAEVAAKYEAKMEADGFAGCG